MKLEDSEVDGYFILLEKEPPIHYTPEYPLFSF